MKKHVQNICIFLLLTTTSEYLMAPVVMAHEATHTSEGKVTEVGKAAGHSDKILTPEQMKIVRARDAQAEATGIANLGIRDTFNGTRGVKLETPAPKEESLDFTDTNTKDVEAMPLDESLVGGHPIEIAKPIEEINGGNDAETQSTAGRWLSSFLSLFKSMPSPSEMLGSISRMIGDLSHTTKVEATPIEMDEVSKEIDAEAKTLNQNSTKLQIQQFIQHVIDALKNLRNPADAKVETTLNSDGTYSVKTYDPTGKKEDSTQHFNEKGEKISSQEIGEKQVPKTTMSQRASNAVNAVSNRVNNMASRTENKTTTTHADGTKTVETTDKATGKLISVKTIQPDGKSYQVVDAKEGSPSFGKVLSEVGADGRQVTNRYDSKTGQLTSKVEVTPNTSSIPGMSNKITETTVYGKTGKPRTTTIVDRTGTKVKTFDTSNNGSYTMVDAKTGKVIETATVTRDSTGVTTTEVKNGKDQVTKRIVVEKSGKTTEETFNKREDSKADASSTKVVSHDPAMPGDDHVTTTTKTDAKGKDLTTTIENHTTGIVTEINHQTGHVSTSSSATGEKVTFRPDGGYSIEGKDTVIDFSIDGNGKPQMRSYSKADWLSKKISDNTAATGQGRGVVARTFGKPMVTRESDGSVSIDTLVNNDPTYRVSVAPDGKIISSFMKDSSDPEGFRTISHMTTEADGTIVVAQMQAPKNGVAQPDVVRKLSKDGSVSKIQQISPTEKIQSWENGPDITTRTTADGKDISSIPNSDGTITEVTQSGAVLTLKNAGSKGVLGTAARTRVIDVSSYTTALAKAKPEEYSAILDQVTLKLTGEDNLFTGKVVDRSVLQSPEYIAFKDSIMKELDAHKPGDNASWVQWIGDFMRRLASRLGVSMESAGLKEATASLGKGSKTESQQNTTEGILSSSAYTREELKIEKQEPKTDGSTDFTLVNSETNGTKIKLNTSSEAVINETSSGSKAAFQPDSGYVVTSADGKTQLTMNPLTGSVSRSRFTNTEDSLSSGSTKQITTVDPKTGTATTITMGKDGITPATMSVRSIDGSVKLYKADGKGNLPDLSKSPAPEPISSMTVNADGSITVKTNRTTMLGKKQSATVTITATGDITTQGFGKTKTSTFTSETSLADMAVESTPSVHESSPLPVVSTSLAVNPHDQATFNAFDDIF